MTEDYVRVESVTKRFKDVIALNNVSVNFEAGKIHGIIGRNGSGKTVLLKCICGFMNVSSGRILVNGQAVKPTRPQQIGAIIENPGFIDSISGYKNLLYLSEVNRIISKDQIRQVMDKVGLDPSMKKSVRKYSLGMRQRLGIAQAIMENPPLMIFDEPMNGLDNAGVKDMRELFKTLREQGKTILLASHNPLDIEELCDTVYEMDGGVLSKVR